MKLLAHPVRPGQARQGFPKRRFHSSCAPFCLLRPRSGPGWIGRDPPIHPEHDGADSGVNQQGGVCDGRVADITNSRELLGPSDHENGEGEYPRVLKIGDSYRKIPINGWLFRYC